jgi:serine/threonine protein kinase
MKKIKSKNLKSKNNFDILDTMKKLSSNINKNLSKYIDFYFNENGDFEILMEYDEDSEFELKVEYNIENHRTFDEDYIWSLTIQLLNLLKFIQQNEDFNIDMNPSKIL